MTLDRLLAALFPDGVAAERQGELVRGTGRLDGREMAILGTADGAMIGVDLALALARGVLDVLRDHPGRPIVMLVDNRGQKLSKRDELLCNSSYLAHLAKCIELARRRGHPVIALVYGEAVSGGFLATGMSADACYALAGAEVRVMALPAMARITQIPLERLEALCRSSPIFAPGVENFRRLGLIHDVWAGDLAEHLRQALRRNATGDDRRQLGLERGGRLHADPVARRVRRAG